MEHDKFTLEFHALPHVREFLQNRYGKPVDLDPDSVFYDYLKLIVSRRPDKDLPEHRPLSLDRYTDHVTLLLPKSFYSHHGLFMTKTNTIKFNQFITGYIKDVARMELYTSFIATGRKESGYDVAMTKLGLTSDFFPFDAIKKDFQRLRKRKPGLFEKKFIQSLSPILSREYK